MSEMLKVSVILNNYNYARYLRDAVESVLQQTYKNFELIIVDDGSTDNSHDIIREYESVDDRVLAVYKENGGQASAFNAGYAAASGDIITFLDSDDCFTEKKLEQIAALHSDGAEYIHTDHQSVNKDMLPCEDNIKRFKYSGRTIFPVYYLSKYPGNVTSTLSLKRDLAEMIFPLPDVESWRIQADDEVVFQAGILAKSVHLPEKLTKYRIHGSNGYFGRERSKTYIYELQIKRNRLKDIAIEKLGITSTFLNNAFNLTAEFATHDIMDNRLLLLYLRIIWYEMKIPLLKKMQASIDIIKIYNHNK